MNLSQHIAKHLREVHVGKNWTWVNLKETLEGLDWQHATTQVNGFNTIATLVYHMNYYVEAQLNLLKTGKLEAHDDFAFKVPPINSAADWEKLTQKSFEQAEALAQMIEELPESKLWEICVQEKYGNYYRNFQGMIEHCHYHLGQIVLLKKWILG
jgi:hypothetical protein